MDKYAWYVIAVYVVTFALLGGYLVWMWLRLRAAPPTDTDGKRG